MTEREEEAHSASTCPEELYEPWPPQMWGEVASISRGPLSQNINYKSRSDFFPAPTRHQPSSQSHPAGPQLPDPIKGIASSSLTSLVADGIMIASNLSRFNFLPFTTHIEHQIIWNRLQSTQIQFHIIYHTHQAPDCSSTRIQRRIPKLGRTVATKLGRKVFGGAGLPRVGTDQIMESVNQQRWKAEYLLQHVEAVQGTHHRESMDEFGDAISKERSNWDGSVCPKADKRWHSPNRIAGPKGHNLSWKIKDGPKRINSKTHFPWEEVQFEYLDKKPGIGRRLRDCRESGACGSDERYKGNTGRSSE
ncbi:hypothetical protein B0H14DRAFT_2607693 [Mycena olivaceomarginata]|nr:hypothetical protein B0H14DRAFT_2607693 [Mycena olivaceomarginata]